VFLEVFLNLFTQVQESHYKTLGVAKNAAADEIRRAYFGLVRKFQPDRFPEEFKKIRVSYETLSDKDRRAEYDAVSELPPSIVPLFHEAQWFERFGKYNKAAEFYQRILKSHPELDNVREYYAESLSADNKIGKAAEIWGELCRRHPENPCYARKLSQSYSDLGWHKKALAEVKRALTLDRTSIDSWFLFITCSSIDTQTDPNGWDKLKAVCDEALDAVKPVKTEEWKKIVLYTYSFIFNGRKESEIAKYYLQEITRLIRECGQEGQDEGLYAFRKILTLVPGDCLAIFYPELMEIAGLLPDAAAELAGQLETVRLNVEIEGLVKNKFSDIFRDLFRMLNAELEEDYDELEVMTIECILLEDKNIYEPQIRRLRQEFPQIYALHYSFFQELLRTRDPDKMLYQHLKKLNKMKIKAGVYDEDPESAPEQPVRRAEPKVGRNDPCPCGSGKKYKRCCGA
jgi:curved DNA-binding protein CbpA